MGHIVAVLVCAPTALLARSVQGLPVESLSAGGTVRRSERILVLKLPYNALETARVARVEAPALWAGPARYAISRDAFPNRKLPTFAWAACSVGFVSVGLHLARLAHVARFNAGPETGARHASFACDVFGVVLGVVVDEFPLLTREAILLDGLHSVMLGSRWVVLPARANGTTGCRVSRDGPYASGWTSPAVVACIGPGKIRPRP